LLCLPKHILEEDAFSTKTSFLPPALTAPTDQFTQKTQKSAHQRDHTRLRCVNASSLQERKAPHQNGQKQPYLGKSLESPQQNGIESMHVNRIVLGLMAIGSVATVAGCRPAAVQPGPVDADTPQEFTETASGLKYRILRKSDGQKPTARDSVSVHYRGWLDDGTEFDSSYARGKPSSFPLNGVIRGWTEGMQLVGVGGMAELWIPPELGYGSRGSGTTVPPNSTLHFTVELIEVK
jgi:hypothetical protein